jgi:hypothetical protein
MISLCGILLIIWIISIVWFVLAVRRAPAGEEINGVGFIQTDRGKNE